MLLTEWNTEEALAVRYEEGRESIKKEIFSILRQGYSIDEAEELLVKREA
jgi:hypothetical protein